METDTLIFFVNGTKIEDRDVDPRWSLLQYLREKLLLRGTKEGCDVGACGSCTVMISKFDHENQQIRHFAVTACLVPICNVHGCAITTVEGIGSTKNKVHAIQERLASKNGTQCGFCSPGFVMSMYTLLRNQPCPSEAEILTAVEGNLCRCTGYRPILDGFWTFSKADTCALGESCCKNDTCNKQLEKTKESKAKHDPSQDPIFPSELQINKDYTKSFLFKHSGISWYLPSTTAEALKILQQNPAARVIAGNTAVQEKFIETETVVSVNNIQELSYVRMTKEGIDIGAGTTIGELREALNSSEVGNNTLYVIEQMLDQYASTQIRNLSTVGGSILADVNWSDIKTLLAVLDAQVTLLTTDGKEEAVSFNSLSQRYGSQEQILRSAFIPFIRKNCFLSTHKITKRKAFDTALLNMAVHVEIIDNYLKNISIAVGGLDKNPVMLSRTMKDMIGQKWDADLAKMISANIKTDFGTGLSEYQKTCIHAMFEKCIADQASENMGKPEHKVEPLNYKFTQVFEKVSDDQPADDLVGRPVAHMSSLEHATGEAQYISDIPHIQGECHLALVMSTRAHARIVNVDASAALNMPGVVDFLTYKDIPGVNLCYGDDELLFATDTVTCVGQTIGAIMATDRRTATLASYKVRVEYEDILPVIVTIEDAIKNNSFHGPVPEFASELSRGDIEAAMKEAEMTVEGDVKIAGQEHYYMETNNALVVPTGEKDELIVYPSSQDQAGTQAMTAKLLNIPNNRITVSGKRIGTGSNYFNRKSLKVLQFLFHLLRSNTFSPNCMLSY